MISFTDFDVEYTLSKNILGNDMYNTVYAIEDVDCANHLVNDHFPVTNEQSGTNHPRGVVCQMEFNISKKSGTTRNSSRPRC